MKKIAIIGLILCGLTAACTVRSERTVVEKPTPAPATVIATPPPPPPGTVVVPSD
jgi:hypothetical protein